MKNENKKHNKDVYKPEYRENLKKNNQKLNFLFNQCPNAWFKQLRYNKKIKYFIEYFLPKTYYKENLNKKIVVAMSTINSDELKTTNEHSKLFQEFVKNVENEINKNKCFENKNIFKNIIKEETEQKQKLERQQLEKSLTSEKSTGYGFLRKFKIEQLYNLTDKTFVIQLIQKLKNIDPTIQSYESTIHGLEQDLENNNKIPVTKICDTIAKICRDYEAVGKNNKKAEVIYNQILILVTITCDKKVAGKFTKLPYAKKEACLNGECLTDLGKITYNKETGDFMFYKNKTEKDKNYYDNLKKMADLQRNYYKVKDIKERKEINKNFSELSKMTINNYEKEGKIVGNFKF